MSWGLPGTRASSWCACFWTIPDFELTVITSNADAGQPLAAVYPAFAGVSDLVFTTHDDPAVASCDVVFLAVPHTAALAQAPGLLAAGVTVIDLSADYRLDDPVVYEAWYNTPHTSPELLGTRAFGLPELFAEDLARAADDHAAGDPVLVACAGCYPTATSLAAAPALRAGLVAASGPIVVDAVSGVTGAGKGANARTHFCHAEGNVEAYNVCHHRHTPEIEQILQAPGRVVFTPHLAPLKRGLLSTVTLPLAVGSKGSRPMSSSRATGPFTRGARSCACSMPASAPRPRRWWAPTPARSGSPSTGARASSWRWAPSITSAGAPPARRCSAPTSSSGSTSDEACRAWPCRCRRGRPVRPRTAARCRRAARRHP